MYSIYEKIMNLSLFKGLSYDSISLFVAKTPLTFSKYEVGDVIINPDCACKSVKCLMSGKVNLSVTVCMGHLKISQTLPEGIVIGLDHLYGMDTDYGITVSALESCSIMEFDKKQLMDLLKDNQLIMINYLNYLSLNAQINIDILKTNILTTPLDRLKYIVEVTTRNKAEEIILESGHNALLENYKIQEETNAYEKQISFYKLLGFSNQQHLEDELKTYVENQIIELKSSSSIIIKSRQDFLNL